LSETLVNGFITLFVVVDPVGLAPIFLVLTFAGVQQAIVAAIPTDLYAAVGAGIGLFLAFIGMRTIGLIVPNDATMVALGDFSAPATLLGVFGLLAISTLLVWRVKGAMVIGIVAATLVGALCGMVHWETAAFDWQEMTAAAFALDVSSAIHLGFLEIVFVFWFVDLFDNVGTLVAVGNRARLFPKGQIPRIRRILIADGAASTVGSLLGTSTVVSYIESAAGVAAGGRSGVTAAVTGLLFLAALFVTPLVGVIPAAATAPALIVVGCLMMSTVKEIDWEDMGTAIPAFLTIMTIPLSFSIANGLAIGFVSYTLLKLLRGEFRSVSWVMYVLTALFTVRFIYLGGS